MTISIPPQGKPSINRTVVSWNDPRDFSKPVKVISLPQDVPHTSNHRLIELENQVQRLMEAHLAPKSSVQVNKIASSFLEVLAHAPIYNAILDKYVESLELGIVKNVEVHIGKLKFLEDFYVIDMEKDPTTPLLVGRGFLATASAVIDYRKAKIAVGEGITRYLIVKIWTRSVFDGDQRVVGMNARLPKSEELIEKRIDWNKPPKEGDGAWHIRIELIYPDGEKFNKTFQSFPTTRKLSEKENPRKIIDLDHFHDSLEYDSESS
ncbi:MAK10-like protein [Tanacetum coccineum]